MPSTMKDKMLPGGPLQLHDSEYGVCRPESGLFWEKRFTATIGADIHGFRA